jgi:hypothetical protein
MTGGGDRAVDDGGGSVIPAHRINCDADHSGVYADHDTPRH